MTNLASKVALIPGASGGIGREVARVFVEAGCDIALAYHSNPAPTAELLAFAERQGRLARADKVDTADLTQARRWVEATLAAFGRIDILASCVGAHLPQGFMPFVKQDPATWRAIIDGQLMSFIYLARPVLEHMLERKAGRIVALSSDGGKVGESGVAVANGGNSGLIGFVKSLAREVGRAGITANLVCPGPHATDRAAGLGRTTGRLGDPADFGRVVTFLCSTPARFVSGTALQVDGATTLGLL